VTVSANLFAGLAGRSGLLVAVSGGPDSMALLLLASRWRAAGGDVPVYAATVDHGLRPESRAEAVSVARWAASLGVPHETLIWAGEKPSTRIQERARDARYALLATHAARVGADTLATAHHADDQAETILFRLLRGSGVAGLAGMARETRRGDLWHARPLLDLGKADLVACCEAAGQAYVRDPSNENPAYARTRMRRLMETLAAERLDRDALIRLGLRAGRADRALVAATQAFSAAIGAKPADIGFSARLPAGVAIEPEILLRLLMGEIARLSGRKPRLDRAEALAERLRVALSERSALRAALGGALVRLRANGEFMIALEPARRGAAAGKAKSID
jgi:tRNA(Ile)-lysidine synthase